MKKTPFMKTLNILTQFQKAEEEAPGPPVETQAGQQKQMLLQRIFEVCFPSNTAIFLVILVTFLLTASDALSDLAMSYYLYSRCVFSEVHLLSFVNLFVMNT